MNLTPVTSSNIEAIGYDAEAQMMRVKFKNGGTYNYAGVPPAAHADFVGAESTGKHFHQHIRSSYEATKHEPEDG